MGRRIATTAVNPEGLSAFVACRLIPLDKCPGVRPIGVGEVPRERQDQRALSVYNQLTPELKRRVDLSKEKGSSSWLSVLPLEEHGFYLHKGEFRDALCLRYGWKPPNIPQTCNCGAPFTVDHAMICHMGGFPNHPAQ